MVLFLDPTMMLLRSDDQHHLPQKLHCHVWHGKYVPAFQVNASIMPIFHGNKPMLTALA